MASRDQDWRALVPAWLFARAKRGACADDLMEWSGLSRSRASALLLAAAREAGALPRRREVDGKIVWAIGRAPADLPRPTRLPPRPVRARTHLEQIERDVEAAREALFLGDFAVLGRLLRRPSFDLSRVQRRVPPRHRDRVAFLALRFHGDVLMERGEHEQAARWLRRALQRAPDPASRADALGLLGAALRMAGPGRLEDAEAAYRAGLDEAHRLPASDRRRMERALLGEAVAPLVAATRLADAERFAGESQARATDDEAEIVQAGTRRALVRAASGDLDGAAYLLEALETRATGGAVVPRFLMGWLRRLRPSLFGQAMRDEAWNAGLSEAWLANAGYGFQLRLIAARVAIDASRYRPEHWEPRALASLVWHTGVWHRAVAGVRPESCGRCRHRPLPEVLCHDLGLVPGGSLGHLCT